MTHSAVPAEGVTTPPLSSTPRELMTLTTYPEVRIAGCIQTGYRLDCNRSGLAMFLTAAELLEIAAIAADLEVSS